MTFCSEFRSIAGRATKSTLACLISLSMLGYAPSAEASPMVGYLLAQPGQVPSEPQPAQPTPPPTSEPTDPPRSNAPTTTGAPPASAQSPQSDQVHQEAAALFLAGDKAYQQGLYSEAIQNFKRSWELTKKTPILFNLAQAHWKRHTIKPNIDDLRQALNLFQNYDNRMQRDLAAGAVSAYPRQTQVLRYIENLKKAIEEENQRLETARLRKIAAEAQAREEVRRRGKSPEEIALDNRRSTTTVLKWTGNTAIILGSIAVIGAGVGLALRGSSGYLLELNQDSVERDDGKAGLGFTNAESDRNLRSLYSTGGTLAFSTIIASSILLPVGITIRIIASKRADSELAESRRIELNRQKRLREAMQPVSGRPHHRSTARRGGKQVQVGLGPSLLRVEF